MMRLLDVDRVIIPSAAPARFLTAAGPKEGSGDGALAIPLEEKSLLGETERDPSKHSCSKSDNDILISRNSYRLGGILSLLA